MMAKVSNRPGYRSIERTKARYRRAGIRSPRRRDELDTNEMKSNHDIEHLYGSLGNGERTNRNFSDIQYEADEKYFGWKQSGGKF